MYYPRMDWTKSGRISIYPSRTKSIIVLFQIPSGFGTKSRTKRINFDASGYIKKIKREKEKGRSKVKSSSKCEDPKRIQKCSETKRREERRKEENVETKKTMYTRTTTCSTNES
jgi:hypothetical protein